MGVRRPTTGLISQMQGALFPHGYRVSPLTQLRINQVKCATGEGAFLMEAARWGMDPGLKLFPDRGILYQI